MNRVDAIKVLKGFYSGNGFNSIRLEAEAVRVLGYVESQNVIRNTITQLNQGG